MTTQLSGVDLPLTDRSTKRRPINVSDHIRDDLDSYTRWSTKTATAAAEGGRDEIKRVSLEVMHGRPDDYYFCIRWNEWPFFLYGCFSWLFIGARGSLGYSTGKLSPGDVGWGIYRSSGARFRAKRMKAARARVNRFKRDDYHHLCQVDQMGFRCSIWSGLVDLWAYLTGLVIARNEIQSIRFESSRRWNRSEFVL